MKLFKRFLLILKKKQMKAKELLLNSTSSEVLATQYASSSKDYVQDEVIRPLEIKVKNLEEKLFDLNQFHLETDKNKGIEAITIADCKNRFKNIVETEVELSLVKIELEQYKKAYGKYFGEEED